MIKIRKNKRKFTFLLLGCAILSLGSVGFSTWILSMGDGTDNLQVNVSIETVYNDSKIINLNDDYEKVIDLDTGSAQESVPLNLSAEIIISEDEYNSSDDNFISGAISVKSTTDTDKTNYNLVKPQGTGSDVFGRKLGSEYTFLDLTSTKITLSKDQFKSYSVEGYYSLNLDNVAMELGIQYGSYFDNKNPQLFYESKINDLKEKYNTSRNDSDLETYLSAMELAKTDVANMQAAINNKDVVITLKVE